MAMPHLLSRQHPHHRTTMVMATTLLLTVAACSGSDEESSLTGIVHIGGKTDQPGFNLHSQHTDRGFEVDMATYLGQQIGFTPQFHDVVSEKREQVLMEGSSVLVIATYSITPARDDKVDFAGPYFVTQQGLLVRKDDHRIKTEKDVAKKDICTVEGSTTTTADLPGSTIVHKEIDYSTCVRKLQEGDIDAVFTDEALLFGYVYHHRDSKEPLRVVRDVSFGNINRYGIGLKQGNRGDCEKLREALRSYLTKQWVNDVRNKLPALVEAYPDYENRFRPDPQDLNKYSSCKEE